MSVDAFVQGDGVRIATRDFGGNGSPVLYVPGAGRNLVDAELLAPYLTPSHRYLAMDVRGHGLSGDGEWSFEAVLNDIRAVIAHYGLSEVTIAGHSLGGMLAAMLTQAGEIAVGINMDGHGMGTPDLYDGFTAEQYEEAMATMRRAEGGEGTRPPTITGLKLALAKVILKRQSRKQGFSRAQAAERIARSLGTSPDGVVTVRPFASTIEQMMGELEQLTLLQLYGETTVPLLVYNATQTGRLPKKLAELAPMMQAYRRGLRTALRALADSNPLVGYQEIDATHDLQLEQPQLVAAQIDAFIAQSLSSAPR